LPRLSPRPYTFGFPPATRGCFGQDSDSWGPHPQPEEHRPHPAARQADRHHRLVRFWQIIVGIRHSLRRRPAPLRRIAFGVCAPVPLDDGKARRRHHRRALPGDLHRAEIDLAQPALHRGHHHRDLRLPASALCAGRHAALSRSRCPVGSADGQPDGRPGAGTARRPQADAAGPGHPRTQGRAPGRVRRTACSGFRARPRQRAAVRARRATQAGQAEETLDRRGGGSLQGSRRPAAAPGRILRNGAQAGRWHRPGRLHGRGRRQRGNDLLRTLRLPDLRPLDQRA